MPSLLGESMTSPKMKETSTTSNVNTENLKFASKNDNREIRLSTRASLINESIEKLKLRPEWLLAEAFVTQALIELQKVDG